jgi:hypothetical protein
MTNKKKEEVKLLKPDLKPKNKTLKRHNRKNIELKPPRQKKKSKNTIKKNKTYSLDIESAKNDKNSKLENIPEIDLNIGNLLFIAKIHWYRRI